jgi:cell division protein FtsI/penicillin-binding protein 2
VTARSGERGSRVGRLRSYGLPFTVPGLSGLGTLGGARNGHRAGAAGGAGVAPNPAAYAPPPAETLRPAPPPQTRQPAPPGRRQAAPRTRGSRHRKQPERPFASRKLRFGAALVVLAGLLAAGFASGFNGEPSAEPTVQSFLIDWAQGHYADAAALTTGGASTVRAQLAAAFTDLDASNEFFAMDHVTQHGATAVATYRATVDLAQAGEQWSYTGKFGLTSHNGRWLVDWTPAVINPRLSAGDRLAVVTTFAQRAPVEDMDGQTLINESAGYQIGVYPGQLTNPSATAAGFSQLTGLDSQQVLGQIQAAPPGAFLSLLTLDSDDFGSLWPKLAKVPGLRYQRHTERLFSSSAQDVVGQVGTENSVTLRNEGAAYEPGMTVGLAGLQQTYQDELVGTPTTSVVVVNAAGQDVATLWSSSRGRAGTPVRTTLSAAAQSAAAAAVSRSSTSAEIVAVDTGTGAVRAIATHQAGGLSLPDRGPLDARVEPGMAFSIVSAAALLSAGISVNHPLPCESEAEVSGVTFTYQPVASSTATLASDFAAGCGTAFANMSRTLTPQQLSSTERAFGVGSKWQLRLSAFSGSAPVVSSEADVAAQATGGGGVLMSPLGLAIMAAEVASGSGHSPTLIASDSPTTWSTSLSEAELSQLRQLMRLAVTSGSARAANVAGSPVYGQAGVVQSGSHAYLSWFVGYRGDLAIAVLQTGATATQAAAALAGTFFKAAS